VTGGGGTTQPSDPIAQALERARGVLPDQGPIGVFVHHNTLHAYQHLTFHEGVQRGAHALGARPYLGLDEFRAALRAGRITDDDLRHEIGLALGDRSEDEILPGLSRAALWHALMVTSMDTADEVGLEFDIREGVAPQREDWRLWEACVARTATGRLRTRPSVQPAARRHRDVLVALGGEDTDAVVHPELIRLASGYLDMGQARTALPGREHGFLTSVCELYTRGGQAPRLCPGAVDDMRDVLRARRSPRDVIAQSLDALGVDAADVDAFLFDTALALPGWTGMFARLECHPEDHPHGPPVTLQDFVSVRLLLERRAVEHVASSLGTPSAWTALRRTSTPAPGAPPGILDAALMWGAARTAGLSAQQVAALGDEALEALWQACDSCTDVARRQIFHEAYERSYRRTILDALAARRQLSSDYGGDRPLAQFVFCIDEREESIRRALEEQHPRFVTYGAAGFFGVAIDYQGLYDKEPAAHCPVVVTPAHEVHEQPLFTDLGWHTMRLRLRDRWHALERRAASASRTLGGGAGLSFLLGPVSVARAVAHVLAPRRLHLLGTRLRARLAPRPTTRLSTIRALAQPADGRRKPVGFSLEESVDRVVATLTNLGLTSAFAPIVIVLGHGSTSLNNPHESAHDCGACGGRRGGANARLFADMANRPDVREGVRRRGIEIPSDTWFVGALHDTANDEVRYYDLEVLPTSHAPAFEMAFAALEAARRDNALERCRRFEHAPLSLTPARALQHVEVRSASLAQPRPEYGHCTNSMCIVGRRELTRGVHLDRRAFLVSYDPTADQDHRVLERILAAVGPVGAGISLEYYFSSVDNEVFGCGTKLPHNVTGLLGVMSGHQSDLRTGLPLQMVEIHEPMRLLVIVDATPDALLTVADRQAEVAQLVGNAWVQLVSVHPGTGEMAVFERGAFVPYHAQPTLLPVVDRSAEWHLRTRDHVPPALVRAALPAAAVGPRHLGSQVTPGGVAP